MRRQPADRVVELGERRAWRSGPSHDAVERGDPAAARRRASQNALPCSYWRSLMSIPISFSSSRSRPERSRRRRSSAAAQRRQVGRGPRRRRRPSRARRSPRARAMNACSAVEHARAAPGRATSVARPSSRTCVDERREVGQVGQPQQAARVDLERAEQLAARIAARCARSHGTPPNCSACVVSCSATQRSSWSGSASSAVAAWPRLGATNSSRAGASGSRTGNSYWPSTRPARKPEIAPASTRQQRARGRADRAERAHAAGRAGRPPGRARRSASSGWPRSSRGRSTASARGSGRRRAGRCRRRRAARSPPRARRACSNGGRVAGGLQVRDPARDRARRASSRSRRPGWQGLTARLRPHGTRDSSRQRPLGRARGDAPASAARGRAARRAGRRTR